MQSLKAAIEDRDVTSILNIFFSRHPFAIRDGMKREDPLWDYKQMCPAVQSDQAVAWSKIAGDVLGFHNAGGGVIVFGVSDAFSLAPITTRVDSKLFNDQIRKYVGDALWVSFNRESCKGGFLGIAIIPPRGLNVVRARADAPPDANGNRYFMALDVCVREGDETKVYRGDLADKYLREHSVPRSTAEYIVNEPSFRILRPEYSRFIRRDDIETTLWTAIADPRCYVTHLTGFGGIGKTAIALWFALELFEKHRFDYIVTASARDRALTRSGIVETSPTLTSYEQLIETILDVLGFAVELQGLTINEKAQWTLDLLQGTNTLLVLDNLETVDDERIFQFIDNLPLPVRTIATSRVQRIQKSVFPVHVGQMSPAQSLRLIGQLVAGPTKGSLEGLQKSERDLIATRCLHIPLAIEWIIARAATAAEALELSNQLTQYSATSDELLEFSFRRVYLSLPESEKNVLGAVAVFDSPQPVEALAAGAGLNALECMDAIESLRLSHLVIELQSESSIGTKVYDANTLVKRFAYVSLSERAGQEQGIRRKLSAWYDALDVKDPDERAVVSEIRKGNRDPEATFTSLGSQLRKQGKYDAADRCLKTAIERRPTSWKAYRERGELFREQKHIRSALEMYELASKYAPKKGPDRALIFRELGMLLPVRATASCGAW